MPIADRERKPQVKKQAKAVRPVQSAGYPRKQFRKVVETSKVIEGPALPCEVARDLAHGSLCTLDAYLKRTGGIPHREVAVALRKLLSGSPSRSKYRIVVIDHPDGPKDKGGQRKSPSKGVLQALSERDRFVAHRYAELLAVEGKKWRVEEELLKEVTFSKSTLHRILRKVKAAEALADKDRKKGRPAWIERRERALERMRSEHQ